MSGEGERFKKLVGQPVVVDTDSYYLYVGKLESVDDAALELTGADVHDSQTTTTTRDVYIINTSKFGIKENRRRVLVRMERVLSISALADVTQY